jgi:hypothetical protein
MHMNKSTLYIIRRNHLEDNSWVMSYPQWDETAKEMRSIQSLSLVDRRTSVHYWVHPLSQWDLLFEIIVCQEKDSHSVVGYPLRVLEELQDIFPSNDLPPGLRVMASRNGDGVGG